jgi:prefoldin subunit 5
MRKEGRAIEELASKFNTQLASVNRHTTELKRLGDDLKELRKKNPSLN